MAKKREYRVQHATKSNYNSTVYIAQTRGGLWPFWRRIKGRYGCKYFLSFDRAWEAITHHMKSHNEKV